MQCEGERSIRHEVDLQHLEVARPRTIDSMEAHACSFLALWKGEASQAFVGCNVFPKEKTQSALLIQTSALQLTHLTPLAPVRTCPDFPISRVFVTPRDFCTGTLFLRPVTRIDINPICSLGLRLTADWFLITER